MKAERRHISCLDPGSIEVTDPRLVALHDYWAARRRGDLLPGRADLDPADIPTLLPWIFLLDVTAPPRAYRFRLIGTGVVEFLGRDYTGRPIDETTYPPEAAAALRSMFDVPVEQRVAAAIAGRLFYVAARRWREVRGLLMPLAADGRTVDMLFCGYVALPDANRAVPHDPAAPDFEVSPEPVICRAARGIGTASAG